MGVARVDGQLSLSRAIGDMYMKQSGIIPDPDVYTQSDENAEYILCGCDGLFDVFTVSEVDDMLRTMKNQRKISLHNTRANIIEATLAYF